MSETSPFVVSIDDLPEGVELLPTIPGGAFTLPPLVDPYIARIDPAMAFGRAREGRAAPLRVRLLARLLCAITGH